MPVWIATVGYVRSLRIGSLSVACRGKRAGAWPCHHCGVVDLTGMRNDEPLFDIERRLACTACGAIGAAEARPNWNELAGEPLYGPGLSRH